MAERRILEHWFFLCVLVLCLLLAACEGEDREDREDQDQKGEWLRPHREHLAQFDWKHARLFGIHTGGNGVLTLEFKATTKERESRSYIPGHDFIMQLVDIGDPIPPDEQSERSCKNGRCEVSKDMSIAEFNWKKAVLWRFNITVDGHLVAEFKVPPREFDDVVDDVEDAVDRAGYAATQVFDAVFGPVYDAVDRAVDSVTNAISGEHIMIKEGQQAGGGFGVKKNGPVLQDDI